MAVCWQVTWARGGDRQPRRAGPVPCLLPRLLSPVRAFPFPVLAPLILAAFVLSAGVCRLLFVDHTAIYLGLPAW